MDIELQTYYENLLDLFTHPGWKEFIEDISPDMELFHIRNVINEQDLKYKQGELATINRILSYEEAIKNSYDDFLGETGV